jgi:hypothetical protein
MSSSSIIKLFFALVFPIVCSAQSAGLSGKVTDGAGQPIAFANVALWQADSVKKTSYTDEIGRFEFKDMPHGKYTLKVTTMGYAPYSTEVSLPENSVLADIVLEESTEELANVEVNYRRPVVNRKIDRLEFDVENSILSSDNAWEILRKTPGVSLSGGGISIRGSNSILVTINDKKVYLTGEELKNLLENTDGDNIKSIEVITTPPSKYEAQGSAVLNIKMKRSTNEGYKGSVVGAYEQSMYPKGVMSTNHYYKGNRLSAYGGYMFGSGHYYGRNYATVKYRDDDGDLSSIWKIREQSHYRATSQNSFNLNLEYQIDSLNTVTFGGNSFFSLKSTANIHTPTYIYDGNGVPDSVFDAKNHRDYPQKNNTLNGSFEHKFRKGKLIFMSDYTWHYFNQSQDVNTLFSLPGEAPYRSQLLASDDNRRISLFSAQADYSGAMGKYNIETGLRFGNVNAENDFDYEQEVDGVPVNIDGLSNRFLYDEAVFAGYFGLDREFGKWALKAGLRGEYTSLEGNSVTTAEVNSQDYFKLFPTLYALYKASDDHQIGLSYGKRISRPPYSYLNPFRLYSTPYAYVTGDPRLQPAITHNISLLYTLKNKYNFDFYYRYEKDPAMEVMYQDYETNTIISKVTNIDNNYVAGLDFNTNLELKDWWQSGIQASTMYKEDTFQGVDGTMQKNKIVSFFVYMNHRFTLDKKKTWTAETGYYYASPGVSGVFKFGDMSSLSASFRKTMLKGKAELSFIFSDIYRGEQQTTTVRYANQDRVAHSYGDTQSFRIQFRYRFGNQKLGDKQRQDADEKGRL